MSGRELGPLLEAFVNRISHRSGRTIEFMSAASVTVSQVRVLIVALRTPDSSPSQLAAAVRISLSSVSQMVDRLEKLGFLDRAANAKDRRRRTVNVTAAARRFLDELREVRSEEFEQGTRELSVGTRKLLISAVTRALQEFDKGKPS